MHNGEVYRYQIDDEVHAKWRDLATKQVVKAAARSAVVLHGIAVHVGFVLLSAYYDPFIRHDTTTLRSLVAYLDRIRCSVMEFVATGCKPLLRTSS